MTTPVLPTLRSIVGQMMMRLSTATSTNRSLAVLTGALSDADVVVQNAINALTTVVDAMPEETITRGKASQQVAFVDYTVLAAATETAWSMDLGAGVSASYLFEFDIAATADDGLDHSVFKVLYGVRWDGATVSQIAAPTASLTAETDAAASSCTADVSGTTVRLRVGPVADWRYGGTVRVTKMEF